MGEYYSTRYLPSYVGLALSNYNTDLFYQPRDYLKACFDAGRIVED